MLINNFTSEDDEATSILRAQYFVEFLVIGIIAPTLILMFVSLLIYSLRYCDSELKCKEVCPALTRMGNYIENTRRAATAQQRKRSRITPA